MKKGFVLAILLLISQSIFAQNEIGPEGDKLLWVFLIIAVITVVFIITSKPFKKKEKKEQKPLFKLRRLQISLVKDT
ncbi:MAG: hypothetical protein R3182_03030, partial [Draconibacterium sp.]|nr:hypothetical protein [Draconibacterium sp.]